MLRSRKEPDKTLQRVPLGLSDFKRMMSDFRSVTAYAVGGTGTLPIVAALMGIAPPWPPAVGPLTSIILVIGLIITYLSFGGITLQRVRRYVLTAAIAGVLSVAIYLGLRDTFTFQLPTTGQQIIVGCGFTHEAVQVARELKIEVGAGCPGQFQELLATASFDNYRIWSNRSLIAVKLLMFSCWLLFFFCFTAAVGIFVLSQRGHDRTRGRSDRSRA